MTSHLVVKIPQNDENTAPIAVKNIEEETTTKKCKQRCHHKGQFQVQDAFVFRRHCRRCNRSFKRPLNFELHFCWG
jgi:hypothetical protein